MKPTRPRSRRLGRKALFALIPALLLCLGAELTARIWVRRQAEEDGRWFNALVTVPDAGRLYRLRPGVHLRAARITRSDWRMRPIWEGRTDLSINRHGMRDERFRARKPEGSLRGFCLGDSIVFGQEVEADQTFCAALEHRLAEDRSGPVELINAGVYGYSTTQVQDALVDALAFDPDLLIVVMPANDVGRADRTDRELMASLDPRAIWLERQLVRSRVFLLARDWMRRPPRGRGMGEVRQVPAAECADNLEQMASAASAAGVPLVLVLPHHLDWPPPFDFAAHRGELWPLAREAARRHGWSLVDLEPAFTRAGAEGLLVDSCHMNAEGHRLAAAELLPVVEALLADPP